MSAAGAMAVTGAVLAVVAIACGMIAADRGWRRERDWLIRSGWTLTALSATALIASAWMTVGP